MSSRVFGRGWVWGVVSMLVLAAACGSADEKKTAKKDYGDGEGGMAGESSGGSHTKPTAGEAAGGMGEGATAAAGTVGGDGQGIGVGGDTQSGGSDGNGMAGGGSDGPDEPVTPVGNDDGRISNGKLLLEVTTLQSPAVPGDHLQYVITVGNNEKVALKGVSVLFRVPKGLSFPAAYASPAAAACPYGSCAENAEATWDLGDLAAGATQTIQFEPVVGNDVGDGDVLPSQVRVNATDLDPLTVTKMVPVAATAPAEVTLSADADSVVAGQELELTVDVGHIGDASLYTGKLSLELPGGLKVLSVTDGGSVGDSAVTWDIDSLPVGSNFKRRVLVRVPSTAVSGDVLNPRASFSYEDVTVENVAMNPITVAGQRSPLVIRLTPLSEPVVPGGNADYNITVSNVSLRAVDGVVVLLRVPHELVYSAAANAQPDAENCAYGSCASSQLSRWTLGTLAAGTSANITVSSAVLKAEAGDGTLVSTLLDVRALKVTPQHLFQSIAVQSKPAAQLSLGTTFVPLTPGQTFDYVLDVGQVGAGSLNQTALQLELPAGITFESASDGGTEESGLVSWSLGAVELHTNVHRTVTVTVPADAESGALLAARASLTYKEGQELDAVSQHLAAVVPETLPLSVTLEANKNPIELGNVVSYTTTVKNNAAQTIDGVTLLLRVPPGLSFAQVAGADPDAAGCPYGSCGPGSEAVWSIGSMAAGATKTININPTADAALVAGSLVVFRQRLTGVDLGGTVLLQSVSPTKVKP